MPMPDVDQALVDYLRTHPTLTALHAGRVATRLAAGSTPAVRITSLGGGQPWPWEGLPEYQVEWWGGDESEAKALARAGEAALWGLPAAVSWVTGVAVQLSMLWSPDDTSGRPRVISQVQYRVSEES
ncbi:hypothetical protein ABT336_00250 [Micromonospora sp. NPDC000207]|uniref:hypothetical protein n=1 Tax=Micromonospora sp. NPDC000207 TaxID=3154246 RepID=UPI003333C03B